MKFLHIHRDTIVGGGGFANTTKLDKYNFIRSLTNQKDIDDALNVVFEIDDLKSQIYKREVDIVQIKSIYFITGMILGALIIIISTII